MFEHWQNIYIKADLSVNPATDMRDTREDGDAGAPQGLRLAGVLAATPENVQPPARRRP
jgi:hypothetical protein